MLKKFDFSSSDTFSKVVTQFSSMDRFFAAEAEAKRQGFPGWLTVTGKKDAASFIGCSQSTISRAQKAGKINGLMICGYYLFLVFDLVRAINNNENLSKLNFASYQDPGGEDIKAIHWIKYLYQGSVLIKYTFERETFATVLAPYLYNRNYLISNILIKQINSHLKSKNQ
jgi:hypothetical protein